MDDLFFSDSSDTSDSAAHSSSVVTTPKSSAAHSSSAVTSPTSSAVTSPASSVVTSIFTAPRTDKNVNPKRNGSVQFFSSRDKIADFVRKAYHDMTALKRDAKKLMLIVTVTGRKRHDSDRVGFGLSATALKHVNFKVPKALFRWNRSQTSGLLQPGKDNDENVHRYMECMSTYITNANCYVRAKRKWLAADLDDLLESRCSPNPPTFKNIAKQLNRTHKRLGLGMDFPFTERELLNKWQSMFPAATDANRTVQYLAELQNEWTGFYFHPEKEPGPDTGSPPKLIGLHVVWPWSVSVLNTIAPNIFCDATYNVTVFHYKVVMITCLDGNRQHRPLMCSFITRSTGNAWAVVFDIFKRRYGPARACTCHCPSQRPDRTSG